MESTLNVLERARQLSWNGRPGIFERSLLKSVDNGLRMSKSSSNTAPWIVCVVAGIGLGAFMIFGGKATNPMPVSPAASGPTPSIATPIPISETEATEEAKKLMSERDRYDETLWGDEVEAQKFEQPIVRLWDRLRGTKTDVDVFADLKAQSVVFHLPSKASKLEYGILKQSPGESKKVTFDQFISTLRSLETKGYKLVQSEWHHGRFVTGNENAGPKSVFNISLHVTGPDDWRYICNGQMGVNWSAESESPKTHEIEFQNIEILSRKGSVPFVEQTLPVTDMLVSHPTLVVDVNGDDLPEIMLPSQNVMFVNKGDFDFTRADLLRLAPPGMSAKDLSMALPLSASVIDEFTGDGVLDLVIAIPKFGVYLYPGAKDGFTLAPVLIYTAPRSDGFDGALAGAGGKGKFLLAQPSVATSGDVDGNGTTDIWIGQYRESMFNGGIPSPIFDANSGYPAFLLINHGNNKFEERAEAAGLGERRHRWTYTGSFWDFDEDGDLDLISVNDFSGVDAYANDGNGDFKMVTKELIDERANFGMGHTIADINRDGNIDLYVTGMSSTTARRLEAMGLRREGFKDIDELRMRMAFGNRIYTGRGKGVFRQPEFSGEVARTGWAWGVVPLDLGNDGFPELYVANGHRSGTSCKDYCTEFWTHDVYIDGKLPVETTLAVFKEVKEQWGGKASSWNGFEKNVLYLNRGGTNFVNTAFLFGLAFEYDSRSVIAEDLDRDGRQDLIVMQLDSTLKAPKETMHVYRNTWEDNGNWIGVSVKRKRGSISGTRVEVHNDRGTYPAVFVNGDSFYCQHSASKHFGLGAQSKVEKVVIRWPDGDETVLNGPDINKYHQVVQNNAN